MIYTLTFSITSSIVISVCLAFYFSIILLISSSKTGSVPGTYSDTSLGIAPAFRIGK